MSSVDLSSVLAPTGSPPQPPQDVDRALLQARVQAERLHREREIALRRVAGREFDDAALAIAAAESIDALRARLKARVEQALARPGVRVVIETDAIGGVGLCGIDPQNLLQVDDGVLFDTRWLRPCAGAALLGEFTAPVVHDRNAGTLTTVIGAPEEVKLIIGGAAVALGGASRLAGAVDIVLESPGLTLRSARADI
jgi:hypothetical protein